MFRTLWRYRELISSLVKRELKTRYKSSALGFFWSLCKPLFVMAILFVVFGLIVPMRFERAYFYTPAAPLFEAADLRDPAGLAARLAGAADPLTRHLRERLTPEGRERIARATRPADDALIAALLHELNLWLISGQSLYDDAAFAGVKLSGQTLTDAANQPQGEALRQLNRALIEGAFAREIDAGRAERATRRAFAIHLMIGILLWHYFAGAVSEATQSILVNGNLIKKVRIAAEVFPVATTLANLVHLALAFVVLIPIMLLLGYRITWLALTLPVFIALETILIAGLAFLVSSTNVFYRDVSSLTEIALMAWFYITPIFYPFSVAWDALQHMPRVFTWLYIGNPMATICIVARRVLFVEGNFANPEMDNASTLKYLALFLVLSAIVYGVGRWVFRKLSPRFADEV